MKPKETKFRRWRIAAGYSLQEVADLTGMDISTVSRIDGGQRQASPITRAQMARRLGARVADLFDPEDWRALRRVGELSEADA